RCLPSCEGMCPEPCAYTRGLGPSVASCRDSMAIVYGPPLYINFPGPKIYSCPQESIVGSSLPQPSAALSSSSSYGGMSGMGGSYGSGGSGMGGSYGSGGSYG
ncbi:KRSC protein, partial [Climacteris rufus]|nr:KRSC protein [Climacteris rufus]